MGLLDLAAALALQLRLLRMMLADVHPEVAPLLGLVGAVGARVARLLAAALDVLVAAQRRLPAVLLAAVPAHVPRLRVVAGPQRGVAQREFVGHAGVVAAGVRLLLHRSRRQDGVALARVVHAKLFGRNGLHAVILLQLDALVMVLLLVAGGLHHRLDVVRLQLGGVDRVL